MILTLKRCALAATAALLLAGCGAARTAVDVAGAAGDYAAADDEWNNFQNEKARKVRLAYEQGMAMHEEYMAMKPAEGTGIDGADAWYQRQSMLLKQISERFTQVYHSSFHDKIMVAESREGEGWDKLSVELMALHGQAIDGHAEKDSLNANLNQALLNAVTYYDRVADDYSEDHPELVKKNAALVETAKSRAAALKAERAKITGA